MIEPASEDTGMLLLLQMKKRPQLNEIRLQLDEGTLLLNDTKLLFKQPWLQGGKAGNGDKTTAIEAKKTADEQEATVTEGKKTAVGDEASAIEGKKSN